MGKKTATRRLGELAAGQHGVVTTGQLEGIGISARRASQEQAAGRLYRLYQGVYAVGHPGVTTHGRLLGAVLASGPGALLSHESAAWIWGISTRRPVLPEVTATQSVRHSRGEFRVHSSRLVEPEDRAEQEEIPLTSVPRTLLDLAGARESNLRWALPRTKRLGLLDLIAIDDLLRRSAGRRGVRRLRLHLDRFRIPVFTRSDLELRFLELVRNAGLPHPSMNLIVAGYEIDAYWDELRFAVELDTYDYHGDEISFEKDRERHENLKLAGIELIRITGERLDREPATVVARLRRHLLQRSREVLRELPISPP